jgi:Carboxypeptidase regulatory-like domain
MLHLTTRVLAWALIVTCIVCDAAHSQTKPVNKIDTGTVSGRVTVKGKGLPGIVVALRTQSNQQARPSLKATTDEDGKYRITNVPAGAYQVVPIAPLFVYPDLSNSGSGGKALLIAEGEAVEGFDFAMVRGGVITGRVTDVDGRPVIEEYVHLALENQRALTSFKSFVQTDDRGIYRAFGVPPGQYRVSAGLSENSQGSRSGPTYRRTFHPSTTDSTQATVIEVGEATESTNVDIILVRLPAGVSASGRVVDSKNGEPVPNLRLDLTKIIVEGNSRSFFGGSFQTTDRKGEFRTESLTPGKYVVSLSQQEKNVRADPVTFDVLDQDVTGLLLKTSVGASLAGTIVFEGSSQSSSQRFPQLIIVAFPREERSHLNGSSMAISFGSIGSDRHSPISADGSFHLSGLPAGTIQLSLGGSRGVVISRIERDGVVQPDGILIQNDEQITGLKVIATQNSGTIRGQVKIENGLLPPGGRFFITLGKVGSEPSKMMSPDVDVRGNFIAEGLASGNYEVTVYIPLSNRGLPSSKQLVTVADGSVSEVTITVDLDQNPRRTP